MFDCTRSNKTRQIGLNIKILRLYKGAAKQLRKLYYRAIWIIVDLCFLSISQILIFHCVHFLMQESYKGRVEQKVKNFSSGEKFYPKDIDSESPHAAGMVLARFSKSLGIRKVRDGRQWVYLQTLNVINMKDLFCNFNMNIKSQRVMRASCKRKLSSNVDLELSSLPCATCLVSSSLSGPFQD